MMGGLFLEVLTCGSRHILPVGMGSFAARWSYIFMLISVGFPLEGVFPAAGPNAGPWAWGLVLKCLLWLPSGPPPAQEGKMGSCPALWVLLSHEEHMDARSQGDDGVGVAECQRAVGRVRGPAGGEVRFSWWIRGFLLEGTTFPACCEPPVILSGIFGAKKGFLG